MWKRTCHTANSTYYIYILLLWSIIIFSSFPRKRIHTRYPTMQFTSICIGPNKQLQHHTSIVKKRAKPRALRTKIHGPLSATAKLLVLYHRTPQATFDRISVCNELSQPYFHMIPKIFQDSDLICAPLLHHSVALCHYRGDWNFHRPASSQFLKAAF